MAVRLGNSSPDDSESCVVYCLSALVDVSNSLAEVELSILLLIATLDLQQSELFILGALASLEAEESGLLVKSENDS